MKKTLILSVLVTLLSNSHANIFSEIHDLDNHKILTQAFINGKEISLSEDQLKRKDESLFGSAISSYQPMYNNDEYKSLVNLFYKGVENLLIKELSYLKNIHSNIYSALENKNYQEAFRIYSTTLNPQFNPKTTEHPAHLISLFGKDIFHKKHAIKVKNEFVNLAISKKIETITKINLETITTQEYKQAILENIDDYFLLAATLIEGLKWTEGCINFFEKLKAFN